MRQFTFIASLLLCAASLLQPQTLSARTGETKNNTASPDATVRVEHNIAWLEDSRSERADLYQPAQRDLRPDVLAFFNKHLKPDPPQESQPDCPSDLQISEAEQRWIT